LGDFHGKGGAALLAFKGPASEFTKDQLLEMLASMK
jgi:hypothetical protein